jgi:hypothetical protein
MPGKTYNKAIINGITYIDLTSDTVVQNKVLEGFTFHDKNGAILEGTCTYDSDTSDANATTSDILSGKTGYVNGAKVTGSMVNNGSVTGSITTKAQEYTIPTGYHDGGGKVSIASTEQAKIIAGNIKSGITILGVEGDYSGESVTAQAKTATPTFSQQTVLPDENYDYLSQVTVNAIPLTESETTGTTGYTITVG